MVAERWCDSSDDSKDGEFVDPPTPASSPASTVPYADSSEEEWDAKVAQWKVDNPEDSDDPDNPFVIRRLAALESVGGTIPTAGEEMEVDEDLMDAEQALQDEIAQMHQEHEVWFQQHDDELESTAEAILASSTPFTYRTVADLQDLVEQLFLPHTEGGTPISETVTTAYEVCFNILARVGVKTHTTLEHLTGNLHNAGPNRAPNLWNLFQTFFATANPGT